MPEADLISVFVKPLNDAGIEYMITGSVASILYGQPRMTHDIDCVIKLSESDTIALSEVFPKEHFYCPPTDVIIAEVAREVRGHFNVIHQPTGLKADFYPVGADPLHRWAMEKRRVIEFDNEKIDVAPPEYVILRKLQFFSEGGSTKHVSDIKHMLRYSESIIDVSVLKEKAAQLGVSEQLNKVLTSDF